MKGTQSSCKLSGCTNLCTLYEGYTEFMQTIRVHRPVYTLWKVHRVHADYKGAQTCVHLWRVHRVHADYQGAQTCVHLWRVHRVHAGYQGSQTCVHFLKGTQNVCRPCHGIHKFMQTLWCGTQMGFCSQNSLSSHRSPLKALGQLHVHVFKSRVPPL